MGGRKRPGGRISPHEEDPHHDPYGEYQDAVPEGNQVGGNPRESGQKGSSVKRPRKLPRGIREAEREQFLTAEAKARNEFASSSGDVTVQDGYIFIRGRTGPEFRERHVGP